MSNPRKTKDELWAEFQRNMGADKHAASSKAVVIIVAIVLLLVVLAFR